MHFGNAIQNSFVRNCCAINSNTCCVNRQQQQQAQSHPQQHIGGGGGTTGGPSLSQRLLERNTPMAEVATWSSSGHILICSVSTPYVIVYFEVQCYHWSMLIHFHTWYYRMYIYVARWSLLIIDIAAIILIYQQQQTPKKYNKSKYNKCNTWCAVLSV